MGSLKALDWKFEILMFLLIGKNMEVFCSEINQNCLFMAIGLQATSSAENF